MRVFLMCLVGLGIIGCGEDVPPKEEAPIQSADMGNDVEEDVAQTPAVMCPEEGDLFCGDRCINVAISMDHCGECNNRCLIGTSTCNGGECICLTGGTMCGNRCYDTTQDHDHCGGCNQKCEATEACVDSNCTFINDRPQVLGVLEFTNATRGERQDCGVNGMKNAVGPLQLNLELGIAAQVHADDMAANNFMEHEGSDGSEPGERARLANYSGSVGENIARGYRSPEDVVAGWTRSDGHCSNMMNGGYSELGVGYAVSSSGEEFWVQLFGTPR